MMNLFRRKRDVAPEPTPRPAPDRAPVAAAEEAPEAAIAPGRAGEEQIAPRPPSYEPWSPDGGEAAPVEASVAESGSEVAPDEPAAPETEPVAAESASGPGLDAEPGSKEAEVVEALKKVYDPEIPVNIYDLGLIYGVDVVAEGEIAVTMTLTTPGCPVAEQMPGMVEHAVLEFVSDAREVDVEIVWDPPWRPDMMTDAAKLELGFY